MSSPVYYHLGKFPPAELDWKSLISLIGKSQHAIRTVDFLFQQPIFSAPHFTQNSDIPKPTAARILGLLRDEHLLHTLREGKGRRHGIFIFRELINIAEGEPVF